MPLRERGKTGEEEEEEGFEQWDAFRRRGCQRWQGGGKISILLANNGAFEHQEYMESKLNEDESVLVASRVKRQLVGSERCVVWSAPSSSSPPSLSPSLSPT